MYSTFDLASGWSALLEDSRLLSFALSEGLVGRGMCGCRSWLHSGLEGSSV